MRGTARSHPLGGSLPPAHHTASGLAPLARGGVFPCTLTGTQLWPQCGCGLWSGRGVAAAAALCATITITITITSSVQNGETAQWGLQCSRRCAWIRQFPRASYLRNRASGCFPLASTNPISNRGGLGRWPKSLLPCSEWPDLLPALGGQLDSSDMRIYLVTVRPPPRDPAAVASGQCWGGLVLASSTEVLDDCGHAGTGQGRVEMGGDGVVMESQQARPGVSRRQPTKRGMIEQIRGGSLQRKTGATAARWKEKTERKKLNL